MKTTVIINIEIEGFHNYPEAPLQVEFLKYPHRHLFSVKAGYKVKDDNREKEIFIQQEYIKEYINEAFGVPAQFGAMSCEMIAKEILEYGEIDGLIWVEVLEDGKGGARVEL